MIEFPNAKINLGLHVLKKRKDGYHNIESCFYPIQLADVLEVIPSQEFSFKTSGLAIPGSSSNNLVHKAFDLISKHRSLPNVSIHLHKVIPMGAGLGGGSSDGAFALQMFNELLNLDLTSIQIKSLASELGSDCPFFLRNSPMIATGRGAALEPIDINLDNCRIELKFPKIHVSTREAYSFVKPRKRNTSIKEVLSLPIDEWQGRLVNDFEIPLIKRYPEIGDAKQKLIDSGAIYASMSGSGSTVFGIFKN